MLIPPACREEVLGDLQEESAGLGKFLHTVVCVVISRVRRTSDPVVVLMEALALYTAFVVVASWIDRALLLDPAGLLALAAPPAAMIVTLMLVDAYNDPKRVSPYKPLAGVVAGAALAIAAGMPLLPRPVLLIATGFGALLMLPIRLTFPSERAQAAKIPADWQKLELFSLGRFAKGITAGVLFALLALIVFAAYDLRTR
ncbi:MAG: hypothetical protein LAO79_22525 [Acidobacteriia bacterium]|nr:hypothetical protein [Terriglobia bacterium]